MTANRLHLNPTKAEVGVQWWCSSSLRRRKHQIPAGPIQDSSTSVLPVSVVRDLDVYLDADANSAHITATVRACFAE